METPLREKMKGIEGSDTECTVGRRRKRALHFLIVVDGRTEGRGSERMRDVRGGGGSELDGDVAAREVRN